MFPTPDTCTSYFILKCFIFTLWYSNLKYMKKVWQIRYFFGEDVIVTILHGSQDTDWHCFFNINTGLLLIPLYSEITQVLEVKYRAQLWLHMTRFVFQEEVCLLLKYRHGGLHNVRLTTFVLNMCTCVEVPSRNMPKRSRT